MKKLVNAVWRRYAYIKLKKKNILVLNGASMHKIPKIKRSIELSETKVMTVSVGLIRYLQPFDVSINKPFKEKNQKKVQWVLYRKYKYNGFHRTNNRLGWRGMAQRKLTLALISKSLKKLEFHWIMMVVKMNYLLDLIKKMMLKKWWEKLIRLLMKKIKSQLKLKLWRRR